MDVLAPVHAIDRFQREHAWAGVPFGVVKRFGEHGAGGLAAAIAYYGFFSLFPLLMALASIASIVVADDPDLQRRLVDSAVSQFPVVGSQVSANVGSIEGSGLTLCVGIVLALWAGIGGVRAAQVAMDTVWDVPRRRRPGTPIAVARAVLMLAVLGAFITAGAVMSGIAVTSGGSWGGAVALLGSAVLNVVLFGTAYRVLTVADVRWSQVAPGAVVAGLAWTGLVLFGGWIVEDRLRSSSDVYGTFAVVIGLLAWIYLGAQITLIGAELDAVLARRLWPRSMVGDDLTEADRAALEAAARQEERRENEMVDVRFEPHEEADEVRPADGAGRRSIGELISSVMEGLKQLVRQELELARIEAGEAVSAKARGAGLMAGAGIAALFALGFLAAAGATALAIVLPLWLALSIVGGVFVVIGAVLALVGRRELAAPADVAKTQESVKEDVRWAKQQIGS